MHLRMPFTGKETGPARLSDPRKVQRCDERGAHAGGAPGLVLLAASGLDSVGSWKPPHLLSSLFLVSGGC